MNRKKQYIPKEIASACVQRLSHDGRGIAVIAGKTTFIRDALPNETVLFNYTAVHSKYNEGQAVDILTASAHRVTPQCVHTVTCGGCSLQHLSHHQQIEHKQATLLEHLHYIGHAKPLHTLPPVIGDMAYYRRKARLSCHYAIKEQKILIGFYEKNSRHVADITHCSVLHRSMMPLVAALKLFIPSLSCYQDIPHIDISAGDDKTAIILRHLKDFTKEDKNKLVHFATKKQIDIYLQPGTTQSIYKFWPQDANDFLTYTLVNQKVKINFHPADFIQINGQLNQKMVDLSIALLEPKPHEKILDLFCGLGNFSLPLATLCAFVIGVEGDEYMVEKAKNNAMQNHISNAAFYQANLNKENFFQDAWAAHAVDKIILDPPRCGAKNIIQHIAHFKAKRILYISCDPATLARDTKALLLQGYVLSKAGILDMFTHTQHVESIAVFDRI